MTDELDVLRRERAVIEPDPQFRSALMDRLRQEMAASDLASEHAHPIDLDREPSIEVRSISRDGRPRLRRLVAVAAVIALIAVGVALVQSRDKEPSVATAVGDPDDQALADSAMLRPEDVPNAWPPASSEQEAQRRADEGALAACLGDDLFELQVDRPSASRSFVSEDFGNPEHIGSTATVYTSRADAQAVTDALQLPVTQRCYGRALEQQLTERAHDGGLTSISGRQLSVDDVEARSADIEALYTEYSQGGSYRPVGGDYQAFLHVVTLRAEDVGVDVYTAVAVATRGRVVVQLSAQGYFTAPVSDGYLASLMKGILNRLPPGSPAPAEDPAEREGEEPPLPRPGPQPADAAAAEEQVRLAFTGIFDASGTRENRAQLSERPTVWADANRQLEEGEFADVVDGMSAVVEEVVFTDPTRAAVRFRLTGADGPIPQSVEIGEAVLVDGRWLVAIDTTCALVEPADVHCDMSL